MPGTTLQPQVATAPPSTGAAPGPIATLKRFTQSAMQVVDYGGVDQTIAVGVAALPQGPFDVPARGFLRHLLILVEVTAGTGTAAVYREDAPWIAITDISLADINGAFIVGPLSGYDLYLINIFGGYGRSNDPTLAPEYVTPTTAGNFSFMLRLPLEINERDALGAIGNRNSAATYKFRYTQNANSVIYSTIPTTAPNMRVRVWTELWSQPAAVDGMGRPQAQQPPASGTTQFWSKQTVVIPAGQFNPQVKRMGNLIRNLILVLRTTAPARTDSNYPDPIRMELESHAILNEGRAVRKRYMKERTGLTTIPVGVFVYDFMHDFDGHLGYEMRDQYLQTSQPTRLEFPGLFGAAGTLDIITNDVVPALGSNIFV